MKAECDKCHRLRDHHVDKWSWVRYRNSYRDRMVCPDCLEEAGAMGARIVTGQQSLRDNNVVEGMA